MARSLLFALAIVCLSCVNRQPQNSTVEPATGGASAPGTASGIEETRLGQSNYYLLLPPTFSLLEARGKEGQLGYHIVPKDTSVAMFGFVGIKRGRPIGGTWIHDSEPIETFSSPLLDKRVQWKVYKTEAGQFDAFTNEDGDFNARAFSRNRSKVDSMVAIIATLKLKTQ